LEEGGVDHQVEVLVALVVDRQAAAAHQAHGKVNFAQLL
jgi:hypothetical protein